MAEPVRVGQLLGTLPGMATRLAEARLVARWPELAGPAGARSRAAHVEAGVLHVLVESSGWLHRLTLEADTLLARCRTVTDVRAIRFHLAPRPASAPDPASRGQGEATP
jgi:predicted nucleic acid-binding Zn ribbon protein